ncbi:MAG: four helix bundle protein [Patescibacteria group bacterium]|jgi:four helix bundle protein
MKDNVIKHKSYKFALRIIGLYKYLVSNKKEFVIAKQVLRSGTSIGANVEEAIGGQSDKDFISKMSIAYKEARETNYWINLLEDSGYIDVKAAESIKKDCIELCRIIARIKMTMKSKNKNNS